MRRRILAAVAAVAAIAVLSGCGGDPDAVAGTAAPVQADPATTTPAATPPTPSAGAGGPGATTPSEPALPATIPDDAVLQAGDWPGGRVTGGSDGVPSLEQTEPSACQKATAFPSDRYRQAARTVMISSAEPESGGVSQSVVRYAEGRGAEAMAEMRRVLSTCGAGYETELDMKRTYELAGQKFVGDDALLIRRVDRPAGGDREYDPYITVVRLQDVLITTTSEVGEGVGDKALALKLADVGTRRAGCLWKTC